MLSKPWPTSSEGKSSAGWKSTPTRSRMVLLYSARLSRRIVTRPESRRHEAHLVRCGARAGGRDPAGEHFSAQHHVTGKRAEAQRKKTSSSPVSGDVVPGLDEQHEDDGQGRGRGEQAEDDVHRHLL